MLAAWLIDFGTDSEVSGVRVSPTRIMPSAKS